MADKHNLYGGSASGSLGSNVPKPPSPAPTPQPAPAASAAPPPVSRVETVHTREVVTASSGKEERFTMVFRNGSTASYPYHFVSLVEILGREEVVLHCTCGNVERITIRGRNLSGLGSSLSKQTTAEIRESDRPEYATAGSTVIESVTVTKPVGR